MNSPNAINANNAKNSVNLGTINQYAVGTLVSLRSASGRNLSLMVLSQPVAEAGMDRIFVAGALVNGNEKSHVVLNVNKHASITQLSVPCYGWQWTTCEITQPEVST